MSVLCTVQIKKRDYCWITHCFKRQQSNFTLFTHNYISSLVCVCVPVGCDKVKYSGYDLPLQFLSSVPPWDCLIKYKLMKETTMWRMLDSTTKHAQICHSLLTALKNKGDKHKLRCKRDLSQRSWMSLGPCPGDHINLIKSLQSAIWAGKQLSRQGKTHER